MGHWRTSLFTSMPNYAERIYASVHHHRRLYEVLQAGRPSSRTGLWAALLSAAPLKRRRGLEEEVVFLGSFKRIVGKLAAKLFDGVLGIANGELFGKKARDLFGRRRFGGAAPCGEHTTSAAIDGGSRVRHDNRSARGRVGHERIEDARRDGGMQRVVPLGLREGVRVGKCDKRVWASTLRSSRSRPQAVELGLRKRPARRTSGRVGA